jgi:hypothetical protein
MKNATYQKLIHSSAGDKLHPSLFWGQVFSHQGSALSSTRLFGARFSATKAQLCHRLVFLGPGFQPPWLRFVIGSPFWGQVFSHQGSALSSTRLFGARFSATMAQVCHRLAFLGPGFQPPWLRFVVGSSFWGQVFNHHGSGLSSARHRFRPPRLSFVIDSSSPFWGQVFGRQDSGLSSTRFFGASAGKHNFPYHQEILF